jgi:hypothetical protein
MRTGMTCEKCGLAEAMGRGISLRVKAFFQAEILKDIAIEKLSKAMSLAKAMQ